MQAVALLMLLIGPSIGRPSAWAQQPPSAPVKPIVIRIGEARKESERDILFPIVIETSGTASVGRIRAELEMSQMEGWKFRRIDISRGLDLRSKVNTRNDNSTDAQGRRVAKLVIEWDLTGEGKELPAGHVAILRVQAERAKGQSVSPASDAPPTLMVRKLSWGLAEFERQPDELPQLSTPDNLTGNPDVSCFFFTH